MELNDFFRAEKIEFWREVPVSALRIIHQGKWDALLSAMPAPRSALIFLIPYGTGHRATNLSAYAMPRDYHLYMRLLMERFAAFAAQFAPDLQFGGYTDSSPIAEREAALAARLGVRGRNGLILNEKYGSYFFIAEIFLSRTFAPVPPSAPRDCCGCGQCEAACPTGAIHDPLRAKCLSLLTQKKNRTLEEDALVAGASCKWGCDLCQESCPANRTAAETPIPFFREKLIPHLSEETLALSDSDFAERAFSWRGRALLRRNLGKD